MVETLGYTVDRPQRVLFGVDALAGLADAIRGLGCDRLLIVTSPSVLNRTDAIERVRAALPERVATTTYADSREHTPLHTVEAAYRLATEHGADGVVGVGGGSALDTAKGIALASLAGSSDFSRYRGTRENLGALVAERSSTDGSAALPLIQIPTTLSAAEATRQAGLTSAEGIKEQFFNPAVEARLIVHDPAVTLGTPQTLWLSTGVKALDHAVELNYSRQTNDFAISAALHTARCVHAYLPVSRSEPENLECRAHLQTAAWMVGSAAMRTDAQMGLDHALVHRLGGYYGVAHGIATCVTLPHAMRANLKSAAPQLARLARWGFGVTEQDTDAAAACAVTEVEQLIRGLGLPTRLRDVVSDGSELKSLAPLVLSDTAMDGNPRQDLTVSDMERLLEDAW